jgi:type III secretion protein V
MTSAAKTALFSFRRYGDVVLALGVVAVLALMVLRLPPLLIDALVALNIACGVGLLLIALYVPHPVAFNSFPSVLLITTLFRLSLSVATTRLILLDAHAGDIIDAFGKFVAGGNLVVGVVVFIIITIVQFIVIAKGAERVAEVAARFTLDAMPGKQLSIDSDLRSGLIDKEEAKRRRGLLERESQMNGALDGAMKFVKGDAIASIIIVIVNLLGGFTIGVLQRDMPAGEAMSVYSILTIGDGMVAQIPALLSAMAAGLIVTRSAGHGSNGHLGEAIGGQIMAHPRALLMTALISLLLAFVPGFPTLVFLGLAAGAFLLARHAASNVRDEVASGAGFGGDVARLAGGGGDKPALLEGAGNAALVDQSARTLPLSIEVSAEASELVDGPTLRRALSETVAAVSSRLGVRFPDPGLTLAVQPGAPAWRILVFDVPATNADATIADASGTAVGARAAPVSARRPDVAVSGTLDLAGLQQELEAVLSRHAERFVGVQEVSNLLDAAAEQYPALVKEVLRQIPAQKVAEVIRNLLREGIPVRNLRDVLESLAEWGSREKDAGGLTEFVRMHLKRYLTSRFAADNRITALVVDGSVEQMIRSSLTDTPAGVLSMLPPQRIAELRASLRAELERLSVAAAAQREPEISAASAAAGAAPLLITTVDVRRHVRHMLEPTAPGLTVISYQEFLPNVEIQPLGTLRFQTEN